MIRDLKVKPLGKTGVYREGRMYCALWDKEIAVMLFDGDVTVEYAEKCARAVNSMPPALVDAICRAAKAFCLAFCDDISEEWRAELRLSVPVDEDTPPAEMLKCFSPTVLTVDSPKDPSRIGYQLECRCDWEEEHGMEIDVLDDELVFLSEFTGDSPWYDHSDEEWNYAARIR